MPFQLYTNTCAGRTTTFLHTIVKHLEAIPKSEKTSPIEILVILLCLFCNNLFVITAFLEGQEKTKGMALT